MTAATSDTDLDFTILDDLDFVIMCRSVKYHEKYNLEAEPADYLVRAQCLKCPNKGEGYIGKRCLDIAWGEKELRCGMCGFVGPSKEMVKIIHVL